MRPRWTALLAGGVFAAAVLVAIAVLGTSFGKPEGARSSAPCPDMVTPLPDLTVQSPSPPESPWPGDVPSGQVHGDPLDSLTQAESEVDFQVQLPSGLAGPSIEGFRLSDSSEVHALRFTFEAACGPVVLTEHQAETADTQFEESILTRVKEINSIPDNGA